VGDGGQRAEIHLGNVDHVDVPEIALAPGERAIGFATVGVPHLVVLVDDVEAVDLPKRGRELRHHAAVGPGGANVNFVSPSASGWAMRTFERGVEAETLACGTGAVASAAFLASSGRVTLPWDVRTASGSVLSVAGSPGGRGAVLTDALLAGEGRLVFRAVLVAE
jgi:diaminopimelate epimerase